MMPAHPDLALLIFRDIEQHHRPADLELPAGIDRNTYDWVRELVVRSRRQHTCIKAIEQALAAFQATYVQRAR